WVELSTKDIKGGIAGHPLEFVDIKEELLSKLSRTKVLWELHEGSWSMDGRVRFHNEPVSIIRVSNPFGPMPAKRL
ncbi:MAG: hypothetical protein ABI205_05655, partial [Gemmatimonadaceae bacterium]